MDIKIIHFYPDLMSLYGSYANVAVPRRALEALGDTVTVETVLPGREADLSGADFLYMGAGRCNPGFNITTFCTCTIVCDEIVTHVDKRAGL